MRLAAKKKEKRERLISVGLDLFSQKGFSSTTIEDVTRRAGVAKGTFYLYFKDKQQFFNEIVESIAFQHEKNYRKAMVISSPVARLKTFIASQLEFYRDNADFARITITAVGADTETFITWYLDIQKKHINFLAEIIAQGCEEGAFFVADAHRAAQFLQGAIFMYVAEQVLNPGEADQVEENTQFIVESFLKGALKGAGLCESDFQPEGK